MRSRGFDTMLVFLVLLPTSGCPEQVAGTAPYVKDLGTQFFASGVDEEDFHTVVPVVTIAPRFQVTGEVKSISGREFKLETQAGLVEVDTKTMPYNPLDDEGYQKIKTGDRVRVTGALEYGLFEDRELLADAVLSLKKDGDTATR